MLVLSRKPGERMVVPHLELAVTVPAIEEKRYGWASPPRMMWPCTGKKFGRSSARKRSARPQKGRR